MKCKAQSFALNLDFYRWWWQCGLQDWEKRYWYNCRLEFHYYRESDHRRKLSYNWYIFVGKLSSASACIGRIGHCCNFEWKYKLEAPLYTCWYYTSSRSIFFRIQLIFHQAIRGHFWNSCRQYTLTNGSLSFS